MLMRENQSTPPEVIEAAELCCLEFPECTCGLNKHLEPITAEDLL